MKQQLRSNPQRTVTEFKSKLEEILNSFTAEFYRSLTETMSVRLRPIVKAKGEIIPYLDSRS